MSHLRQQIRERIAANVTSLTTTSTNVFQSRVYNLQSSELPGLLVYTKSEESEIHSAGSTRNIFRTLSVIIEAYVQSTANSDDTIDTICKEIEVAMAADININSLAVDSYLASTEIQFMDDGKLPTAIATLTYIVEYRNAENSPETAT